MIMYNEMDLTHSIKYIRKLCLGNRIIPFSNPYYMGVGQSPANVSRLSTISKGKHYDKICMGNNTFLTK